MIDKKLIAHLAELSKIELTDEELTKMSLDMAEIIEIMDMVKDFDIRSRDFCLKETDYDNLREDSVESSFPTERILSNAKGRKDNTFTVPKVV